MSFMEQKLPFAFLLLLMNAQALLLISRYYLLSPSYMPGAIIGSRNSLWQKKAIHPSSH